MKYIHPFPARMAPEIVLDSISNMKSGQIVLDPMVGSGMVLSVAARKNINSVGVDLDPLARIISTAGASKINEDTAVNELEKLIAKSHRLANTTISIPWIDDEPETHKFISYWFGPKQICQLKAIAWNLFMEPTVCDQKILNILIVALSRLIITKEPKASLARDTAHSRPHRTILENNFDIFEALPKSLKHVLGALNSSEIRLNTTVLNGDSRCLNEIRSASIDSIITSPPYLNAIDYMRGHKFSLVWLGYSIPTLRKIRANTIGSERIIKNREKNANCDTVRNLCPTIRRKTFSILVRYLQDLISQLKETERVLKGGGVACYVIGNSFLDGCNIKNNEFLKEAAKLAGLNLLSETVREIPENRRYLPIRVEPQNSLSKRMKNEFIITFSKN